MSSLAQPQQTPEHYLAQERASEYKSEFINGHIYSMTGASREHNLITTNLSSALHHQLRGRRCECYASDMRVRVSATGMYAYPDVVAVCDTPNFEDTHLDTLTNPTVIVEVLSPSTEAYDRGAKFGHYRRIESLSDYVLIAQDRISIEHFVRQGEHWVLTEASTIGAIVHLASINCDLAVNDVYDKVVFPVRQDINKHSEGTER